MKKNKPQRIAFILLLLAIDIALDQGSKAYIRHKFDYYQWISFLHKHITITRVENSGAFLSLGDSLSGFWRYTLLNVLPLLAITFGLVYILIKDNLDKVILWGIILILGGGIGNLYDRMLHGSVTDFMHIDFVIFQTGVFNVGDMSIMAGTFMILLHSWLKKEPKTGNSSPEEGNTPVEQS